MGAQLNLLLHVLLCALVLAGCPGTEPLPPTGRTVVVALEADHPGAPTAWRGDHRATLGALAEVLAPTGDTWVVVNEGVRAADLTLRTFDSGPGCPHGGGNYVVGGRDAWVDYACAHSANVLLAIATHEILHYLSDHSPARTVEHICRYEGEEVGCWAGGVGDSVMNPVLPPEFDPEGEPLGPTTPELNALTLRWVRGLTR